MKLKFILLFLFIANFCAAQNQLKITSVYYHFGDTIEHYYYLHENQEAKIKLLNSSLNEFFITGTVKKITDSFLMMGDSKIYYNSILKIGFNKSNHEKQLKRIGKYMLLPESIFLLSSIGVATKLAINEDKTSQSHYSYFLWGIPLYLSILYSPIALIGLGLKTRTKTFFYLSNTDNNKHVCKMSVIHPSPTK